jgi:RHS repeat-associated protein
LIHPGGSYTYDAFNQLIGESMTPYSGGVAGTTATHRFVYDMQTGQMDLAFDGSGNLTDRFLWGPLVDQILADEKVTSLSSAGSIEWMATNNTGSVSDVFEYGSTPTLLDHVVYDAFGGIASQTDSTYQPLFTYNGEYTDPATGLQKHGDRWYDPRAQRWLSQDPIFPLSGSNPYEYCGNSPTNFNDPSGMAEWWRTQTSGLNYVNPLAWLYGSIDHGIDAGYAVYNLDLSGAHSTRAYDTVNAIVDRNADPNLLRNAQTDQNAASTMQTLAKAAISINAASASMATESTVVGEGVGSTCPEQQVASAASKEFSNCFPANTPISTQHGPTYIQDVRKSDLVWSFDLVTGNWMLKRVIETFAHEHLGILVTITLAEEVISATSGHPFWVIEGDGLENRPHPEHVPETPNNSCIPGRWVDAGALRVDDLLLLQDGQRVAIKALSTRSSTGRVYNFHVEDFHCYAVGSSCVLVHNNSAINNLVNPGGQPIGVAGSSATIREIAGSHLADAQTMFNQLAQGGKTVTGSTYPGTLVSLPGGGTVGLRTVMTDSPGTLATIDVNVPGVTAVTKIKFNP